MHRCLNGGAENMANSDDRLSKQPIEKGVNGSPPANNSANGLPPNMPQVILGGQSGSPPNEVSLQPAAPPPPPPPKK